MFLLFPCMSLKHLKPPSKTRNSNNPQYLLVLSRTVLADNLSRNSCKPHTTHNSSIRSDEGLTLETSAFESPYGGQFTLSTQLMKPNYQPTYDSGSGNRTRDTLMEGERDHHCATPVPLPVFDFVELIFSTVVQSSKVQSTRKKAGNKYNNIMCYLYLT